MGDEKSEGVLDLGIDPESGEAVRVRIGYVGVGLPYEPLVLQSFWTYTLGIFWLGFAVLVFPPRALGAQF